MPVKGEVLRLLHRLFHRLATEDPLNMLGQSMILGCLSPKICDSPDGAVRNACRKAVLVAACAGGIVAPKTRSAYCYTAWVNILTSLKPIDALAYWHLGIHTIWNPVSP